MGIKKRYQVFFCRTNPGIGENFGTDVVPLLRDRVLDGVEVQRGFMSYTM